MDTKPTNEWHEAWCACKDTVREMTLRGFFKTFRERLWEIVGGALATAFAIWGGLAPEKWTPWVQAILYGVVFLIATFVLWYARCLHALPSRIRTEKQTVIEDQRIRIAESTGYWSTFDNSLSWVTGTFVLQHVAWVMTDQTLSKLQIETTIADQAANGRFRVIALPVGSSQFVEVLPAHFKDHTFVLEPLTAYFINRFGRDDNNGRVWGRICRRDDPSKTSYESPRFEKNKIPDIWPVPGTLEYRRRRELISSCRCYSEQDAKAHIAKCLNITFDYAIEREISQAVEDEHITIWGRKNQDSNWKELQKDELPATLALQPYVTPPGQVSVDRTYPELAFCKREFDVRWTLFY